MVKIYITLTEAEKLIFNKILVVEAERLEIKKAQQQYSVAIAVYDSRLVSEKKILLVLISDIKYFEIPKVDQGIFINHYKVPRGLIKAVERKVRDPGTSPTSDSLIENFGDLASNLLRVDYYQYIRRGLLHVFYEMLKLKDDTLFCQSVLQVMNTLVSFDDFTRDLVLRVIDEKSFPTLAFKTEGFMPDSFFNWAWWGKFTRESYLETIGISEEETLNGREWLKDFDPRGFRFDNLNNMLLSVPPQLKEISALLVGYYLAFTLKDGRAIQRFQEQGIGVNDIESSKLIFWNVFFEGLFDETKDFLYATEIVAEQFREIDKRALKLTVFNIDDELSLTIADLELPKWGSADAARAVYALRTGRDASELVVLEPNNILDEFDDFFCESPLYGSNKAKVGIIGSSEARCDVINNYIIYREDGFVFEQENLVNPDLIFYGEFSNNTPPASIKVKRKPFDALIPRGKRILLLFHNASNKDGILDVYARCIRNHKGIEKVIVVWDVPCNSDELQTLQFDSEKARIQREYSETFCKEVTLIIKSKFNVNHTEITRLLRQSLAKAKLKQIEIVDDNFDATYAEWLIKATDHYLIADIEDRDVIVNTW